MQLIYRGMHYMLNSTTNVEVPVETTIGKYRGAILRIGQSVPRSLPNSITGLQYRGNCYVKP